MHVTWVVGVMRNAQPLRPGTVKSVMDAKQGGVGVAFRSCHTAAPSPRSSIGDALYESGRWQSISVKFHRSSEIIHVVPVFLEAGSLGSGSVVICGDF